MTNEYDGARGLWGQTATRLRKLLNEDTYDRWIAGIVPLTLQSHRLRLGVSNDMFSEWLTANYRGLIANTIEELTGEAIKVVFESGYEAEAPEVEPPEAPKRGAKPAESPKASPFNRRFTFSRFVVGENSKFAHAACMAVAQAPGKAYNPLFIHGATGLGKTHLIQAVAQEISGRRRRARIEYLSSEDFANSYIDALRDRALPRFRRHFRHVDALLIDDIHFLAGKEQFQEEFFHTFNALYNGHRQIVLTSDRPPHEIRGLEKRLVSWFEWGLTTEILLPDLETRVAILKRKQEDHTVRLDDEVLFFIASRIRANIRRLEGALIRLVSYASMTNTPVTLEEAQQLLRPILEEEASSALSLAGIQRVVADFYDVRLADMSSKRRPRNIAFPRQIAMYICRKLTNYSSPAIAEAFNRNHATVLHAVRMIEGRMQKDIDFRHTVGRLERTLRQGVS